MQNIFGAQKKEMSCEGGVQEMQKQVKGVLATQIIVTKILAPHILAPETLYNFVFICSTLFKFLCNFYVFYFFSFELYLNSYVIFMCFIFFF